MHQDVEREFAYRRTGRRGETAGEERRERRESFELYWLGWRDAAEGRPEEPPTDDEDRADWYALGYLERREGR